MSGNKIINSAKYGKGFVGLFKQGWNEIPEIIGSTFMGVIGLGIGATACYIYYSNDRDNRKYRRVYTVIRDDDPRVPFVRKD